MSTVAYDLQIQFQPSIFDDFPLDCKLSSSSVCKEYQIIDYVNSIIVGMISLNPTLVAPTDEFENFKQNIKHSCGPTIAMKAPIKRQSVPKAPKALQPPSKQVQSIPLNPNAPKIDVTSMMSITQNMSTNERSYKCSFCGQDTVLLSSMRRHIETKHLPSTASFACQSCDYTTKLRYVLKNHYIGKHGMPELAARGMMAYYS